MFETLFPEGPIGTFVAAQVGGGTPSRQNPGYWNGPIPWASVKDFDEGQIELTETDEYVTQQGLTSSATNLIPANTPIVCTRMAVGRVAVAPMDVAINQDLKALFPTTSTDTRYLLRLADYAKPRAEAVSVGSTVKGIKVADYLNIRVPLAPPPHQSKIAEILDTLDAAIRGTEVVVAKLKAIKQGLLHDLLTRGVDANGNLRPPKQVAPDLYKQTPLGWLPKQWSQPALEDVTSTSICYGIVQVFSFVDNGVPVLAIRDLLGDYQTGIHRTARHIDAKYPRSRVKPGDVLLSIKGTIGRVGVVPEHFTGNISRDIGLLRPNNLVKSSYLSLLLRSNLGQQLLADTQVGTTRAELSIAPLKRLRIPLPPMEEQISIAERVGSLDERLQDETEMLSKLRLQKSGLMDDLLTGRTPVTVLL